MSAAGVVTIRAGREKPVRQGHPWVFSGAIASAQSAAPGAVVTVVAHDGAFLGRGYWNPKSQIQVRLLTWRDETIDKSWWRKTLRRAVAARLPQLEASSGCRLVNAESDFLPGLIVDRYADYLVLQALTLHIDQRKEMLAQLLVEILDEVGLPARGVYERSDVDVRAKEGLKPSVGLLWGEEPPARVAFCAAGSTRLADIRAGHKTGYYLDQLVNHRLLAATLANSLPGARLLNLFSYSGGFGLAVDGPIVNVDASREALSLASDTYATNSRPQPENVQADAFQFLRDAEDQGERFDAVVCDPPKFAHTQQQVERAARGYKDLNLRCFRLLNPGGYLMTFSCSGAISADLFQKIVFGALVDSGRQAQILQQLGPGSDHPVALTFPEGAYLKGLLLRVY
ncbi:MAG: class I SAM-dependent rRNA methyltransferase [Aggregatilineales bacterium]